MWQVISSVPLEGSGVLSRCARNKRVAHVGDTAPRRRNAVGRRPTPVAACWFAAVAMVAFSACVVIMLRRTQRVRPRERIRIGQNAWH